MEQLDHFASDAEDLLESWDDTFNFVLSQTTNLISRTLSFAYLDKISGNIPSSNIQSSGKVRERKAFINWANVSYTISRVHHHSSQ